MKERDKLHVSKDIDKQLAMTDQDLKEMTAKGLEFLKNRTRPGLTKRVTNFNATVFGFVVNKKIKNGEWCSTCAK